jgi:hypothetical protein
MNLSDTLERQLFKQALEINGYRGNAPRVIWGGMRAGEAETFMRMMASAKAAGLKPTEKGVNTVNRFVGVEFEVDETADAPPLGRTINKQRGDNPNKVKM